MADNAQPMTASMLCLLPRILPAPQALLKPTRPTRLPSYKAQVVGIYSGMILDSVGSFANIIHPLEEEPPLSFRVLKIRHRDTYDEQRPTMRRNGSSWSAMLLPRSTQSSLRCRPKPPSVGPDMDVHGASGRKGPVPFADVEKADGYDSAEPWPKPGIKRRRTVKEQMTHAVADPTLKPSERPAVPPALGSPIHILTLFSFALTLAIFGLTAHWRDGNALLAVVIISLQASLVGYASWWRPQLTVRPPHGSDAPPPGDMMIRTREGAFVLVRCSEEVARELYTGAEECAYHVGPTLYRCCMAAGTALLMVGVVLLGNTGFEAQALVAGGYVVLNGAYWLLGMLPRGHFWDLSRYEWEDVTPDDARNANDAAAAAAPGKSSSLGRGEEDSPSFTRTLWYAIRETGGQTWWVERSGAAPSTPQWQQWIREAGEMAAARPQQRGWAAVARKNEIMRGGAVQGPAALRGGEPVADRPEQRAPATVPDSGASAPLVTGSL